jgi:hypothetical protein
VQNFGAVMAENKFGAAGPRNGLCTWFFLRNLAQESLIANTTAPANSSIPHLHRFGWMRIESAVPVRLCERLVDVLETEMHVPVHDQSRWHEPRDLIPIWGNQAQWDIRQHPDLNRIWTALWKTDRLAVSLDSCRFTPPWRPGDPLCVWFFLKTLVQEFLIPNATHPADSCGDGGPKRSNRPSSAAPRMRR